MEVSSKYAPHLCKSIGMENTTFYFLNNFTLQDFDQKESTDFWQELFEEQLMKITFPINLITIIIIIPTYFLFLSYLHTKHIRTMLTHAEFIIFFYVLIYQITCGLIDTFRIVSGPLSPTLCWWNIYFKNTCAFGIELGCCISIIVRVSVYF